MFSKVVFVVERLDAAVTFVKIISVGCHMVQLHANLVELFVAVVALEWFLTSVVFHVEVSPLERLGATRAL